MLTTYTIAGAGSAAALRPGAPVARPEGRAALTVGEARSRAGSRHDANGCAGGRGVLPMGIGRQVAQPAHTRASSAGGRDRAS